MSLKYTAVVFLCLWISSICMLPSFVNGTTTPNGNCMFTLVESIPENLTYSHGAPISMSTYAAHKRLMSLASKEIHIASFYWTLRGTDISYSDSSAYQGEDIFKSLLDIAKSDKIDVQIAQNSVNNDTNILASAGAQVRTLNFTKLLNGGVLHTKMWVVDDKHMYVGSANFDWRSYTQVKETGILIEDCEEVVADADKIFDVYWYLGKTDAKIPKTWPAAYSTVINATSPLPLMYNSSQRGLVYLSSSPPPFCATGRTTDLDAILNVIFTAREFVYISVMDYLPAIIYQSPESFWPLIDDALRKVAFEKKIKVYLMCGCWEHSIIDMFGFLKTLDDLHYVTNVDVQVKYFIVPIKSESQSKIPFARVNHSKFMVTDQHAYIGTSNWSGDYFIFTGGVGFILKQAKRLKEGLPEAGNDLRQKLQDAFTRDWYSGYASDYCKRSKF